MTALDPAHEAQHEKDARQGVIGLFRSILADIEARSKAASAAGAPAPDATLGDVVDRLDERAFGLLFMILALPCIPPFVMVLPQIVSVPMVVLGAQMATGRQSPWLPEKMRARAFPTVELGKVLDFCEKYVRWVEAFARPRLPAVTDRFGARIVGVLMIIPGLSVLFPMIGTNTVPSIGMAVVSLGLVQRDGLLVILGLMIGVGWVVLLFGVIAFFGVEAATHLIDWIKAQI